MGYSKREKLFILALSGLIKTLPFFLGEEYGEHDEEELEVQEQLDSKESSIKVESILVSRETSEYPRFMAIKMQEKDTEDKHVAP